jgi:hypothetical protein
VVAAGVYSGVFDQKNDISRGRRIFLASVIRGHLRSIVAALSQSLSSLLAASLNEETGSFPPSADISEACSMSPSWLEDARGVTIVMSCGGRRRSLEMHVAVRLEMSKKIDSFESNRRL